jgi:phospholipid-transporting ATPase
MFFLVTGSIQLIPGISPTSPIGTILPLIIILIFTLRKEITEDSKRHKLDYSVNHTHTLVLEKYNFVLRLWKDIKVGDLVKVTNNQSFPADLIIVSSCEDEGQCYIETSNLDGETNLKIRQSLPETKDLVTAAQLSQLKGTVKSELPNNSLYTFDATMIIKGNQYPLSPDQLLLRGSQLRNTDWIVGLACFTGHETKLVMNSTSTPVKKTKIDLMVNDQIIFLLIVLLTLAFGCATLMIYIQVLFSF